ncbi:MAG: twin-arginine translocation protein TatB subunit, partial [Actinotalea sp.]|nr:twin-arginine translocation protein TatB subunit [Actinotalea sp.]
MFGVNGSELLVLIVVALLVVGPERLPAYAEQLAVWVRSVRRFMSTAKERVASELGEEAADVDWASLDPRRYDPRRIVREALLDDLGPSTTPAVTGRRYTTGAPRAAAAAGSAAGAAGAVGAVGGATARGSAVAGAASA